jgi:poly-gamma-glutamate synthesis protein (capsule biosynthesis protein)
MDQINLLFSGDFAPLVPVDKISNDYFEDLSDIIEMTDLHITNLECPLTGSKQSVEKTGPSIKADPAAVSILQQANVNIVCLANNHIFDYGEQGIEDTIEACQSNNIETLGIVKRKDGRVHWLIKSIKDKKIGFLNYCEHEFSVREEGLMSACGYDPIEAFYDVGHLKPLVDYLIIIYHGGNEYYPLPRPQLKKDFHYLADIGADVVVGHHTHVFSGYEIYNNKPLIYSLGNFFFPYEGEPDTWHYGLVCLLVIDEKISIRLKQILQCKVGFKVESITIKEENRLKIRMEELSNIIKNDAKLKNLWIDFVKNNGMGLSQLFLYPSKIDKLMKKMRLTSKREKRVKAILNVIKCNSLRNLLQCKLESENKI